MGAYYFGVWSFLVLITSIGGSCNWGIGNALAVLLVQHKEDAEKCSNYIFNSSVLLLLTGIPPLLILGYDRIFGIPIFAKYQLGNFIYAVTILILLLYLCNFFINIFRVRNRIWEITIQQTLWPVVTFFVAFFASGRTLLNILTIAYLASMVVSVYVFFHAKQIKMQGRFSLDVSREIFQKGIYLFLYNTGFVLIVSTTKLLISKFYKVEEFGYFAFAFNLAQGVMYAIDCFIFLLFPKMIDMLKGNDMEKIRSGIQLLRKNYILPLHLLFYCILIISPGFFLLFPQFNSSFKSFILILFTLLIYSQCFGYNSYLLAQNREKDSTWIVFGAFCMNLIVTGSLILAFRCSYDIAVLGTLMTYALYSVTVNCYALYRMGERNWKVYLQENFPVYLMMFYIGTLVLVLFVNVSLGVLSGCVSALLLLFILFHIRQLKELIRNAEKLIKNDRLMDV